MDRQTLVLIFDVDIDSVRFLNTHPCREGVNYRRSYLLNQAKRLCFSGTRYIIYTLQSLADAIFRDPARDFPKYLTV